MAAIKVRFKRTTSVLIFLDDEDTKLQRADFKRLPFNHCALTFLPFKEPVCTPAGEIFDKQ